MTKRNQSPVSSNKDTSATPPTESASTTTIPVIAGLFAIFASIVTGTIAYFTAKSTFEGELRLKPGSISVSVHPIQEVANVAVDAAPALRVSRDSPLARFDNLLPGLHQIAVRRDGEPPRTYIVTISGGDHAFFRINTVRNAEGGVSNDSADRIAASSAATLSPTAPSLNSESRRDCCWIFVGRVRRAGVGSISNFQDSPVTIEGRRPVAGDVYALNANVTLRRREVKERFLIDAVEYVGHFGIVPSGTIVRLEEVRSESGGDVGQEIWYARVSVFGDVKQIRLSN